MILLPEPVSLSSPEQSGQVPTAIILLWQNSLSRQLHSTSVASLQAFAGLLASCPVPPTDWPEQSKLRKAATRPTPFREDPALNLASSPETPDRPAHSPVEATCHPQPRTQGRSVHLPKPSAKFPIELSASRDSSLVPLPVQRSVSPFPSRPFQPVLRWCRIAYRATRQSPAPSQLLSVPLAYRQRSSLCRADRSARRPIPMPSRLSPAVPPPEPVLSPAVPGLLAPELSPWRHSFWSPDPGSWQCCHLHLSLVRAEILPAYPEHSHLRPVLQSNPQSVD